ncbi:MAG TPA: hypothetical protein VK466_00145 [Terriglobales bacterium]|nr:hypothetical protein [Terriglobales bacterium]
MLYKCANEASNTPFRRLREGKLFQMETEYFAGRGPSPALSRRARPWRRVEHYWLCDACSPFVTLTFDRERGVVTVPLPDGSGQKTVKMVSHVNELDTGGPSDLREERTLQEVRK